MKPLFLIGILFSFLFLQLGYAHPSPAPSAYLEQLSEILFPEDNEALLTEASIDSPLNAYSKYPHFKNNPFITKKMRAIFAPYLMPSDHPLRPALDALFLSSRAIENETSFFQAGFILLHSQQTSYVRVAWHPNFPEYLFKIYLDSETRLKANKPGWLWLVNRCNGATRIRKLIKKQNITHFVVPDKWLYPLPPLPSTQGPIHQPIILIETDMNLVSRAENKLAWKEKVTPEILNELYIILSHGYGSWFLTGNIPYTKNGTFAFIDTEYPKRTIRLHKAKEFLSAEMQLYWDYLIESDGP
jgi:hypothetical protein